MRIVTLVENTACRADLAFEHGLSLYIEACGRRILFDAGQTDAFARNAALLGIDLAQVDLFILSHGHYDHGGGLQTFLECNQTAPIYLHREAFGPHFNGSGKYIGLDRALLRCPRLHFVEGTRELAPGLILTDRAEGPLYQPIQPFGLCREAGGSLQPEDFRHEQYLLISEGGQRVCISGCSHRGIANILRWFRPDVLIGGFHFQKLDPAEAEAAAYGLLRFPTEYYTGHCTGQAQFDRMKPILGNRLHALSTGRELLL